MKIKKSYILIVVLLLIAAITNPNTGEHKEAVKEKLNAFLQTDVPNEGSGNKWEQTGKAFGQMLGGALIEKMIDHIVSSDNYLLFSTTKVTWQGETKMIGVGVFGQVFIPDQFNEKLNDGLLDHE